MIRKPLVIVNGQVQRIQDGDVIQSYDVVSQVNGESTNLVKCTPVYNDTDDSVKKAKADSATTKTVVGLVFDTTALSGANVTIICSGTLKATTAEWDAAFGTSGGLVVGTTYFLSDVSAGAGTSVPADNNGSYLVELGVALSTTELLISSPFRSIKL